MPSVAVSPAVTYSTVTALSEIAESVRVKVTVPPSVALALALLRVGSASSSAISWVAVSLGLAATV